MNMETKIYAAYGSNMNFKQMGKRCPQAKVIGTGQLPGYKLTFRGKRFGYANVEPGKDNEKVPIVLWAITQGCEEALDKYEGFPELYGKERVTISTKTGGQEAMIYVMTRQYEKMPALPNMRYYKIIEQGYQDNEIDAAPLMEALKNIQAELHM